MTLWIDQQRDKNGQTATRGFDPMDCLFFAISSDGRTAQTQYYDGGTYRVFETISAANICAAGKRMGSGKLSALATTHVWSSSDPVAFARWVEDAATAAGR